MASGTIKNMFPNNEFSLEFSNSINDSDYNIAIAGNKLVINFSFYVATNISANGVIATLKRNGNSINVISTAQASYWDTLSETGRIIIASGNNYFYSPTTLSSGRRYLTTILVSI